MARSRHRLTKMITVSGLKSRGGAFAVPSGMGTPLILPEAILRRGYVKTNKSIVAACYDYNASIITAGARYISPSGSDSNPGTEAQPYLTLNRALRDTLGSTRIYLKAGAYAPNTGPRNGDTSQPAGGRLLHVSPAPGVDPADVVIRVTGDDLTTNTWTLTSGTVYETTISGSTGVTQVTRADILGSDGFPLGLRSYTSVANLEAGGTGYYWDSAARKLHVALAGWNVETNKAILKGYYNNGSDSRIYVQSAPILFENCNFEGVYFVSANAASQPQNQIWISGGRLDRGMADQALTGCLSVIGDGLIINGTKTGDNWKGFSTSQGFGCTIYCINLRSSNAGAVDTLGTPSTANGFAMHGTGGKSFVYGGTFDYNAGPNISLTGGASVTDYHWLVGVKTVDAVPVGGGANDCGYGIANGTSGNITAWLDSCVDEGSQYDLFAEDTSTGTTTINLHNSPLPDRTGSGATISDYARHTPN